MGSNNLSENSGWWDTQADGANEDDKVDEEVSEDFNYEDYGRAEEAHNLVKKALENTVSKVMGAKQLIKDGGINAISQKGKIMVLIVLHHSWMLMKLLL